MKKGILIAIIASLLAAGLAWPQGPERTTKMYQLKWRNARDIAGLLGALGCCFSVSDGFNTISATTDSTGHTLLQNLKVTGQGRDVQRPVEEIVLDFTDVEINAVVLGEDNTSEQPITVTYSIGSGTGG